jgi:hypothetical protein
VIADGDDSEPPYSVMTAVIATLQCDGELACGDFSAALTAEMISAGNESDKTSVFASFRCESKM